MPLCIEFNLKFKEFIDKYLTIEILLANEINMNQTLKAASIGFFLHASFHSVYMEFLFVFVCLQKEEEEESNNKKKAKHITRLAFVANTISANNNLEHCCYFSFTLFSMLEIRFCTEQQLAYNL